MNKLEDVRIRFIVGLVLGILWDITPIQAIKSSFISKIFFVLMICLFNILCMISILWDFYDSYLKQVIIGISIGSFFMTTTLLFTWVIGHWELISSTFSILLSIYFLHYFKSII